MPVVPYAANVSRLRSKLMSKERSPESCFAILTENDHEATFKPRKRLQGTAPNAATHRPDDSDIFVLIAPPGKVFSSLEFHVVPNADYRGMVVANGMTGQLAGIWLKEKDIAKYKYDYNAENKGVVCFGFGKKDGRSGIDEFSVRVEKWSDMPSPAESANPPPRKVVAIGPIESVPVEIPGCGRAGLADAAVTMLDDGRWLMAFSRDDQRQQKSIMLTTSNDGLKWTKPWAFENNKASDSVHPALLRSGADIQLFFLSNRCNVSSLEKSGWFCRSRDARSWDRPSPILPWQQKDVPYYDPNIGNLSSEIVQLAEGAPAVLDRVLLASGILPGNTSEARYLNSPLQPQWGPASVDGASLLVDAQKRSHFFAWHDKDKVYYCQPSSLPLDFEKLPPAIGIFSFDNDMHRLLPLVHGDHMILLYGTDDGVFLRGGPIRGGRPFLGKALPLPGLAWNDLGRRFFVHQGRAYLPIGRDVPSVPDLEEEPPPGAAGILPIAPPSDPNLQSAAPQVKAGASAKAGVGDHKAHAVGDGPRMLRFDIERVLREISPRP
jgi:hypothetical protein